MAVNGSATTAAEERKCNKHLVIGCPLRTGRYCVGVKCFQPLGDTTNRCSTGTDDGCGGARVSVLLLVLAQHQVRIALLVTC